MDKNCCHAQVSRLQIPGLVEKMVSDLNTDYGRGHVLRIAIGILFIFLAIGGASALSNDGGGNWRYSGFYSLLLPSGEYNLTAASEPRFYINNSIAVNAVAGSTTTQDIELLKKSTGNISGSILAI